MAPTMIPGEVPYTPEEMEQLNDLVSQAADQDPGEDMEDQYISEQLRDEDRAFIMQTARDYDMDYETVRLFKKLYSDNFYEKLEEYIKNRSR